MTERSYVHRPLAGRTVCYVSTSGFSGTTRTQKQAKSLADAGARVIIAGYEELTPPELKAGPFETLLVTDSARVRWNSIHPIWLFRVAMNLTVNRVAQAILTWNGRIDRQLSDAIVQTGADIVQAVDLPALSCAAEAAVRMGARLVYDSHELWVGFLKNPDLRAGRLWARALLSAERKFIGKADLVLATSEVMAQRLAEMYGIAPPLAVLNSPPGKVEEVRATGKPVRLVFHGGLSADRNLDGLIRAMALLRDRATLDIHGFSRTIDTGTLQDLIDNLDLRDAVNIHGPFEYEKVLDLLVPYDIGVLTARMVEENFEVTLPNKVFDCMCAGVAVAMSDSPALRSVLQDVPFGITIDPSTPETIAAGLDCLVGNPGRIDAMKRAAIDGAPRYWWPEQGRKLIGALERMFEVAHG